LTNPSQFWGRRNGSSVAGGLILVAMLAFAIGCGGSGDDGGGSGDAGAGTASGDPASASPESGGSGGGAAAVLHYSPDDSFIVMNIDVATIVQSQVGKDMMAAIAKLPHAEDFEEEIDEEIREEFGVSFSNLKSVTMSARPLERGPEFVTVLRLNDAVDANSVLDKVYMPDWWDEPSEPVWDEPSAYDTEEAIEADVAEDEPATEDDEGFAAEDAEESVVEDDEGFADEGAEEFVVEEDEDDAETRPEQRRRWERSKDIKTGTYYVGRGWSEDDAIWFPDDRTIVHGPVALIKQIERRNRPANVSEKLARRIKGVDFDRAFAMALEMPKEAWDELQQEAEREVPWLSLRAIESFQAGSLEITAGDDVKATATIEFASGEIAADAAKATEGAVAVFKHLFELSDDARKTLDAIEVTVSEGVVKAELTVSGKILVDSFSTVAEVIEENF